MTDETKIKEAQISDLSADIEIQETDVQKVADATVINFEGDVTVVDEGGGKATVTVSGSGGSGTDADAIHDNVSGEINSVTKKVTGHQDDVVLIEDSESSYAKKGSLVANLAVTDSEAFHDDQSSEIQALTEKTSPADADVLVIEDSESSWTKKRVAIQNLPTGSGSGGGSTPDYDVWDVYAPYPSASSYDDEFNDTSFDTGLWSTFDQSSLLTITEEEYGLRIEKTANNSTSEIGGVYQTAPSTPFTVTTKVQQIGENIGDSKAGIFLAEDIASNPTTCDFYIFAHYMGSSGVGLQAELYSNYNTYSSGDLNNVGSLPNPTAYFFRVRVTDEGEGVYQWRWDVSTDGMAWFEVNAVGRDFTPSEVGLFYKGNGYSKFAVTFPFFRIKPTENAWQGTQKAAMIGDRINKYLE